MDSFKSSVEEVKVAKDFGMMRGKRYILYWWFQISLEVDKSSHKL